jgi:uncharacterized membrane protein
MTTFAAPVASRPILVSSAPRNRLDSIDLLRGIVMVLMALDHTRDFALAATLQFGPTDLTQTTPLIFLTRWVTHYCAPIFVLLAGTGSYLQRLRGKSVSDLSRFLITRGLWLVVLEFTAVRVLWLFSFDYSHYFGMAQVIWAIGCSMIGLGLLVRLPPGVIGVLGLALVSFHNLLDRFPSPFWVPGMPAPTLDATVWKLLHGAGFTALGHPYPILLTGYALIPWFGVLLVGYALGMVYAWDAESRRRFLVRAGIAASLAFIAIRAVNHYGDPSPWSVQRNSLFTVLSFVNVTKYPPSLDFLLMTLGPALIALALFERVNAANWITRPLITFGRVPLFFYLLQWPAAKGLTLLASVIAHKPTAYLFGQPPLNGPIPADAGFGLGVTYGIWLLAIVLLYPLCVWYAGVKRRHRDWWWLSYL